jgi:hypothetical protein
MTAGATTATPAWKTSVRTFARLPLLAVVSFCATSSLGQSADPLKWPEPNIAPDAQLSNVGEHMAINGVPVHIYQFNSGLDPEQVVRYFRERVERDASGAPQPDAQSGRVTVGGRAGDFWLTLQVRRERGGSSGTWSAAPRFVPNIAQPVRRPPGFPASATLVQQIDSFDRDKRSQMALGIDPAPVDGVAVRLESEMRSQGYAKQSMPRVSWPSSSEYVAVFGKGREEVVVSLLQESAGTAVIINRISALEELK